MEPAVAVQALTQKRPSFAVGGRPCAALLLFLGLLCGCGQKSGPSIVARWRIGLGACAMGLDPAGKRLAVVCRRSNDVWVLGPSDGALQGRFDTLPRPRALVFHPENNSFYVAEGLSSVALVSLDDHRVQRSFRPPWPVGAFAYEPGSRRLFCAQIGVPILGVYRLKDMHLETSLIVGGEVQAIAFLGQDAWVVTRQADALLRIALKSMSVQAVALAGPEPRGLAIDPAAGLAYIPCRGRAGVTPVLPLGNSMPNEAQPDDLSPPADAQGGVDRASGFVAGPTDGLGDSLDAEDGPPDALASPANGAPLGRYQESGVAVLRLSDVRRVDYIAVEGGPIAVVLAPSRRLLAVACDDGMLRLVDLATRKVSATLDLRGRPGAMLGDPAGSVLWVALRSDKALAVVSPGKAWR